MFHKDHSIFFYYYLGDEVIGYDDLQSMELKVCMRKCLSKLFLVFYKQINYAKEQRLGGIVIFPVNFDDSAGQLCNHGKFPIVSLVKELTSNYTVSCAPLTTPPLNTTTAARNRTKNITPKWKIPRTDYFGPNIGPYRYKSRVNNSAHILNSIYIVPCVLFQIFFLIV